MKTATALLCLLLLAPSGTALAETRYVRDELVITVRSGESNRHQIIKTIKSGTAVEVLETHPDTGYSRVRLRDGTEGWVLSQYLTDRPIARQRLAAALGELERARQRIETLRKQINEGNEALARAEARNQALLKQIESLEREVSHIRNIAGHAPALSEQNQSLKADVIRLETMVQTLEQENMLLKDRSARDWFIAGTGVTLLGMAIGFVAYKIRGQKRSSWSEL